MNPNPSHLRVVEGGEELTTDDRLDAAVDADLLPEAEIAKPLEREEEQRYAHDLRAAREGFATTLLALPDQLVEELAGCEGPDPTAPADWRLQRLDACHERMRAWREKNPVSDETAERFGVLDRLKQRIDRARDALIVTNLGFVGHVARQFDCDAMTYADLVQEGNIGLIRAVDKFDPSRGHRFTTYAYWWIRQSIARAIAEKSHLIRIPDHAADLVRKLRRAQTELREKLDREPLPSELATRVGISREQVLQLMSVIRAPQPLEDHGPDGDKSGLVSRLADPRSENPLAPTFRRELKEQLRRALDQLEPRERKVLRMRFGLGRQGRMTLEQIGRMFNLTRERIRQIEVGALKKIHAARDDHDLERHLVAS